MADAVDVFEQTDTPQPWHRQRTTRANGEAMYETPRQYDLFRKYAIAGPKRSFVKLSLEVGKSRQYIERVASRWKWAERTRAFDSHTSDIETEAFLQERRNMARRQAQLGVLGQNIAAAHLMAMQQELQVAAGQRPLKVHEIARLLDVSSKLERINRGENDEEAVAKIIVHIERQAKPRYLDADAMDADAESRLDS